LNHVCVIDWLRLRRRGIVTLRNRASGDKHQREGTECEDFLQANAFPQILPENHECIQELLTAIVVHFFLLLPLI